ncbi:hypothetical protein J437_LFUL007786 [Ladona fulva]|uniref:ATP-dependent DNA helicase n=1 Tax=Ladona fulva TaxID=123851 RepID=A0A8K0NRF9_LADFU|nr:hypothetical protein J437_LFUL007786 [Ladona fulva]
MVQGIELDVLDRLSKDITGSMEIFGNRVVALGGDFKQGLPVLPKSCVMISDTCMTEDIEVFGQKISSARLKK